MVYSKLPKATTANLVFHKLEKFRIWLFLGCFIFGLAYFWQVNSLSNRGFLIKDLQNQITSLKNLNQKLEVQAAAAQSLENIQEKIKSLNMVAPDKVEYFSPVGTNVALK